MSMGQIYRGYTVTPAWSIIDPTWAIVDALIGGIIFAWLYNFIRAQS